MRKYWLAIALAALWVIAPALSAQTMLSTRTDLRLVGVELGVVGGYNLQDNANVMGRSFALTLTVQEAMQIGFAAVALDGPLAATTSRTFVGMRFDYYLFERLCVSVMASTADQASYGGSVGLHTIVLRSQPPGSMASSMKMKLDYFMNDVDGPGGGTIAIGLASSLGY